MVALFKAIVRLFETNKCPSYWTAVSALSRKLLIAISLGGICAAAAAENRLIQNIGDWQLFLNRSNTCAIGATIRGPDKSMLNLIISFPDAGALSSNDPLLPIQVDVQDNRIIAKQEATQKNAILQFANAPFKGAIVTISDGKIILLFFPRSDILSRLSNTGAFRVSSNYFNLDFPFKPLRDQIGALVKCEQARKSQ